MLPILIYAMAEKSNTMSGKVATKKISTVDPEIRAEITAQLIAMKTQLNKEMLADLTALQKSLREEFSNNNSSSSTNDSAKISRLVQECNSLKTEVQSLRSRIEINDKTIKESASAARNQQNNQLAIVKQSTGELMKVAAQQIERNVFNKVVREIDTKIVPKIDNMVRYVNYSMQDGAELINDFRREVETQNVDVRAITDGKKDTRVISPHVRTFFSNDSDSD